MITVVETPQRSNFKISYEIIDDVLRVTIDDATEDFDFTSLPEGIAEEITAEVLPVNPIVAAGKAGDEITITLIRFYGEDEKEEFEDGPDQMGI